MIFTRENTEFPTIVHRLIYLYALRQTPLDISLNGDLTDNELIQSCEQYHAFVMNMLSQMYENPDLYGLKAGEYDSFLGGLRENAMKQKMPDKTLAIRSETYNCVPTYFHLLNNLGNLGEICDEGLIISKDSYTAIKKNYDSLFAKKPANVDKTIPYAVRLKGLMKAGLGINEKEDGGAILTSQEYPNMFMALSKLAKAGKGVKPFGEHNFTYTDFRQIWGGYNPKYEDVTRVLPESQKEIIDKIHEIAKRLGLRDSCTTFWKVNYHYKGKHVMCIDTETDWMGERSVYCNNVRIRINGAGTDSYTDSITAKGEEFLKYFRKNMNYCTACSVSHKGWQRKVFGRMVRLCGDPSLHIKNPTEADLTNIEEVMKLKMEEIKFEKLSKSVKQS